MKLLSNKTASTKSLTLINQIKGSIRFPLQKKSSEVVDPQLNGHFDRLLDESSCSLHFSLEPMESSTATDITNCEEQDSRLHTDPWEGRDKRSLMRTQGTRHLASTHSIDTTTKNVEYVVSLESTDDDASDGERDDLRLEKKRSKKKKKSKKKSDRARSHSPFRADETSCMQLLLLNRVPSERNCAFDDHGFNDSFVSAAEISLESLEEYEGDVEMD